MQNSDPRLRSFAPIGSSDLERLLDLARQDRSNFFAKYPDWANLYSGRVLGTALCQGAAWHFVRGDIGINDFDVYTFYASHPDRHWFAQRIKSVDFGNRKFGRSEISPATFIGRRVDLLARGLKVPLGADITEALINYLAEAQTATARELAKKAVVMLEPKLGSIVWPRSHG